MSVSTASALSQIPWMLSHRCLWQCLHTTLAPESARAAMVVNGARRPSESSSLQRVGFGELELNDDQARGRERDIERELERREKKPEEVRDLQEIVVEQHAVEEPGEAAEKVHDGDHKRN